MGCIGIKEDGIIKLSQKKRWAFNFIILCRFGQPLFGGIHLKRLHCPTLNYVVFGGIKGKVGFSSGLICGVGQGFGYP